MRIKAVDVFSLQPARARLTVVRVRTDQDGLEGIGCATFTQRPLAVESAVRDYLAPLVTGRDPADIEDLWHVMMNNAYWRNGPVLNCAVSGIDMALWDIKGKVAGLPCYDLWGGKARQTAAVYMHANGSTFGEVKERVQAYYEQGLRHVRCQLGGYAGLTDEIRSRVPAGAASGAYFDPRRKLREIPRLFEYLRSQLPEDIELLHDVHERLAPIEAVRLAKDLEPYRLFFLEDILAPEDLEWFRLTRQQCATPLAMGELFVNPREIVPLIREGLIDFVRIHVPQLGGITPALKLARTCEMFGVRTAWHGPGDLAPPGKAANVHLDIACHHFGVQEWTVANQAEKDVFPGVPEVRNGVVEAPDRPGLGLGFTDELVDRFPCAEGPPEWTVARLPDGTAHRP